MKTRTLGALLPLAVLLACGDTPGPEDIASHDDELVGGIGVPNASFTEVGLYGDNSNGNGPESCTATLIGGRYVLTAAHCLQTMFTDTSPGTYDKVKLWSATDALASIYSVDRIHSFGSAITEPTGKTPAMCRDLALLRLSSAVPATVAKPIAISEEAPRTGVVNTIWGFGCTNRDAGTGGGPKQLFTFTMPGPSQALCPGDSGGPVTATINGVKTIWGVNSGYLGNGNDEFGDVPYLKYHMELVMRQWDTSLLQVGYDRPGLDARVIDMSTPSEMGCFTECQKDTYCRAFSYEKPGLNGTKAKCHLKSGVPDWVPREGVTSGLPVHRELSAERPGTSYRDFDLADVQAELCTAECMRDDRCKAYTYEPPASTSTSAKAHCWLKDTAASQVAHATRQSGMKRSYEYNVDRPATVAADDYAKFDSTAPEACRFVCASDSQCRAFTWVPAGFEALTKAQCRLKKEALKGTAKTLYISAVKRGLEVNIDRAGGSYRTFTPADPRPELCQATCASDAMCQSWAYHPPNAPGVTGATGLCALKSTVRTKVTMGKTGYVSGLKGAEFFGGEARL